MKKIELNNEELEAVKTAIEKRRDRLETLIVEANLGKGDRLEFLDEWEKDVKPLKSALKKLR